MLRRNYLDLALITYSFLLFFIFCILCFLLIRIKMTKEQGPDLLYLFFLTQM